MVYDPLRQMRERLETDRQLRLVHRQPEHAIQKEKPYTYRKPIPVDLWVKCPSCGHVVAREVFEQVGSVCEHCSHHYRLDSRTRLEMICDPGSFAAWDTAISSLNPIQYEGYCEKIDQLQKKTELTEAIVTGQATIEGQPCAIGVMDSRFMMGSMGSVVGEKITRLFDRAAEMKRPVVLFVASGGAPDAGRNRIFDANGENCCRGRPFSRKRPPLLFHSDRSDNRVVSQPASPVWPTSSSLNRGL